MSELPILRDLGFILVPAAALLLLARLVRVPGIVAYILAGLTLGPLLRAVEITHSIERIADVGIVLLLFLVGLELSVDKVRDVGGVALAAGLGQVVFTAAGGFGLAFLLGFTAMESVFLATALTFSSTVVVVKLLGEKRELDSLYGRIAVGIFLVQDLVVIVVLTLLAGLGDPELLTAGALSRGLGMAFGGMILLLAAAMLASRYLLPRLFGWVGNFPEITFIWGLCWCFLVVVAAVFLRLSPEIGAFVAGVALAQLPHSHGLKRRVHPLTNFFIAVFFVSLGVQMELGAAMSVLGSAAVLSLFVLIGNPLIFMLIISRMGYGERTAFLTSVTVAQISEFSFIFAAVGMSAGLIDESILSLVALVGLVTIAGSAFMINYNHQLYHAARRIGLLRIFKAGEPERTDAPPRESLRGHVIVVGMNTLGREITRALATRGEVVLAIDTDADKLRDLPARVVLGSADEPATLEEADLAHAKLLISALQIEDTNAALAYHARKMGVPSSVHAFDASLIPELREIGADHLMVSKHDGIRQMADELTRAGVLR